MGTFQWFDFSQILSSNTGKNRPCRRSMWWTPAVNRSFTVHVTCSIHRAKSLVFWDLLRFTSHLHYTWELIQCQVLIDFFQFSKCAIFQHSSDILHEMKHPELLTERRDLSQLRFDERFFEISNWSNFVVYFAASFPAVNSLMCFIFSFLRSKIFKAA